MHEVLISLLARHRELIHEVCISLRRAESPKRDQNLVNRCYAKTTKDRHKNQNNTTKCQFPFKKEGRKRDCSSLIDLKYAKISVK